MNNFSSTKVKKRTMQDKIHFNILIKRTGQKQIDRQVEKTITARKQESRNVPDFAIFIISFAFTF